jgi:hypothetical protein
MGTQSPIPLDSNLIRSTDVVVAPLEDGLAIMQLETNAYYTLDNIGMAIWNLLEKPASLETICGILRERFDVAPEQCERDVRKFLTKTMDEGLIRVMEKESR